MHLGSGRIESTFIITIYTPLPLLKRTIPNQDRSTEPIFARYPALCYIYPAFSDLAGSGSVFALKLSYRFCRTEEHTKVIREIMTLRLTRRAWIRVMVYSSFFLTGATACFSSKRLEVVQSDLSLKGLPREADGLRIGIMSDFHSGASGNRENIFHSIAVVNEEKPDLIVLLGDYMDAQFSHNSKNIESRAYIFDALQRLEAPLGIYAVLGNHDHYIDAAFVQEQLSRLPAVILNNQSVTLDNGLAVAGVDDLVEGSPDPLKAIKKLSHKSTTLLLSHNPDINLQLRRDDRVSLVISGHTHGGQIRIPFIDWAPWVPCSNKKYKVRSGLIRETENRWTFVTKGIGTSVVPVRVACPPDVGILRLRRA